MYLDSLSLGSLESIQDYFLITQDEDQRHVTRAVCVLYSDVLLLFRHHHESSLTSWDRTPGSSRLVMLREHEKLFVYGYLYPRHIHRVTRTPIGISPVTTRLIKTGFQLDCKGIWLGEDSATEWLHLEFQASNSIPGDGLNESWIHTLQMFMIRNPLEISTIFDRVPLDKVSVPGVMSSPNSAIRCRN